MAAKQIKEYKTTRNTYPSEDINPELKDNDEYALAYCEAMIADYSQNKCEIPFEFDGQYSFETLRKYAQGKEGNEQVKKNFFGEKKKDPETGLYPTTVNVSWDGMDVMPKMFDVMRSINQKVHYKTTTRAIDSESLQSKKQDRELLKFLISDQTKELLDRAKRYKPSTPVSLDEIGAETESDIDLYFDCGAYIMQREIASDAACQKTRNESMHKIIQDMCYDDLITIAIAGVKTYIDKASKVAKIRYVDPAHAIVQYSKYLDFRNIVRAGEVRTMSILELREEYPHISDKEWVEIANDYSWLNPEYRDAIEKARAGFYEAEYRNRSSFSADPVNSCKLLVLDAQWLSVDTECYLHRDGSQMYKQVNYGYEVKPKDAKRGAKLDKKKVIKKYYASWLVGTKKLLDRGVCEDVVYYGPDGNKTPRLDYFFAKTGNKSLVERSIPHIEDIHLAAVKRRNAIAELPPGPRMIVQQQLMENVWLNGIKQQPEDLYQKFKEKGFLVVNNLDDFNKPIFQNSKAIEFVPSGVLEDISIFTNEIKEGIERIREVTGLNATVDASTPNTYVGLGKSQMAATAANNALSPTFNSYNNILIRSTEDIIKKWQIIAKNNKGTKVSYTPLGAGSMQILELGEEFTNADFNIYVDMEYTDDERQMLLARIIEMNKAYQASQGSIGLSTAEYLHLEDMIMSGSFKFAKYVIARIERKREMSAMRFKRESEMLTFEEQRKNAAQAQMYKVMEVQDEKRKAILSARISEAEKRKTKLTEVLADSQVDPSSIVNQDLIKGLIEEADIAIQNILEADLAQDQQRFAELNQEQNVQQVA